MLCKTCQMVELKVLVYNKEHKFELECPRCGAKFIMTEEEIMKEEGSK